MSALSSGQRHAQALRSLLNEDALRACLTAMYEEVLVPICSAPGSAEHHGFVMHHLDPDYPATEWRFQGSLGFGGKFRLRSDLTAKVDCYGDEETPERREVIDRANTALAEVRARYLGASA